MATIKDVAKEAGLAVGTVSRILNNRGYISDDARRKVAEAMKKLNYQPDEAARSLHGKCTNTIGLIVPHIRHPYFSELISHVEDQACKKGCRILLCNSQSTYEKEKMYVDMCINNKVVGIILCSGAVTVDMFEGIDIPVVTIERYLENGVSSVECDNKQGGVLAAERLISSGCKHLLYIGSVCKPSTPAERRLIGFRAICKKENIPFAETMMHNAQFNKMSYQEILESTLQQHPETDGIFANSDVIAAQVLQVCRKLHISVPDQMKVIGFDDTYIATLTTPQLTTIHQPVKEMAEIAINLLCDSVAGKLTAKRTVLPVCLVERETV